MAGQRSYRPPLIPVERGADVDIVRWLARESVEKTVAADGMHLVEYHEREVPAGEVPKAWAEHLGRPIAEFTWYEIRAVGEFNQDALDWLTAEGVWKREQIAEWLNAAASWQSERDAAAV